DLTESVVPCMTAVKRSYDASGRRAAAQRRRTAIVRAAHDLFERDAFRGTTITAVARRAGVAPETIYKAFGTKAALAKAVFDLIMEGDEDLPVAQQSGTRAIRAEPDVRRKIELYVDGY